MQSAQEMQNNDLSSGIDNAFDSNSGMEITAWNEVNIIGGSDVSIKVINNTEKTVSAFEVAYELIDGFGEPVSGFASLSGSGIRLGKVADCEIAPGKSLAGTFTELTAFAKVSRVAVIRVGFADGTQWISPGYEAVRNSG